MYAEIGHTCMSEKIILRYGPKTVRMVSFVEVAFICLEFRAGIVESCQKV